ncbi:MAG: PQQ-binding-like beta-propeller repeat protein [Isosphaeraceae bacterium]
MTQANDLIRKAVTVDPSSRPAETTEFADPLGPPTTLVLRSADNGPPSPASPGGPLVFAQADGLAYAVDGSTGAPVWQRPVGLSSPFPPQPIPGGSSVLVVDSRHDALLRLDARDGTLRWRQQVGEAVAAPPLVLGNQVIQPTPSGKLLFLDLNSGSLQATVNLGIPVSGTPVSDELGGVLYVTAARDSLFVLARDPLSCLDVVYLGHAAGSVVGSASRVGRYLIVPENHEINESRWRVLVANEDGTKLKEVQSVPVSGWTWGPVGASGSVVWADGDRGGVAAYAVGAYGEKEPFRLIARLNADAKSSGPAFSLVRSERELWIGSGRSGRYDLDLEKGRVTPAWTMGDAGPALAPPQAAGPLVVLTQENTDGPGAALWGVDPQNGTVRWKTLLGTAWPSPPTADVAHSPSRLTALGADGGLLTIGRDLLARGGFVTSTLPRPGSFRLPGGALARLDGAGWTVIVRSIGSNSVLVRAGDSGPFTELRLPVPVRARPLAWGSEMLLPGADGRAYLVDPVTGQSRAEPYIPSFDRSRPTRWRGVVLLDANTVALADDAGRVRRITRVNDPRPRLVVAEEVSLGKPLTAEPASAARAVVVVTDDGKVRSLASRDLSPAGVWSTDAPLASSPSVSAGRVFVADLAGGILALGEDGQRLWSVTLPGKTGIVGTPTVAERAVFVVTRDGMLHVRSLADGAEIERRELGVLAAAGPIAFENELIVPAGMGSLRPVLDQPGSGAGAKP